MIILTWQTLLIRFAYLTGQFSQTCPFCSPRQTNPHFKHILRKIGFIPLKNPIFAFQYS